MTTKIIKHTCDDHVRLAEISHILSWKSGLDPTASRLKGKQLYKVCYTIGLL